MKCSVFKLAFSIIVFSALPQLFSDTIHEVQKGETLYSISKSYGLSVDTVKEANGLPDSSIKVGQKIKIPDGNSKPARQSQVTQLSAAAPAKKTEAVQSSVTKAGSETKPSSQLNSDGTYTVQKGETWYGISKKYGITVADLQKLNGVGPEAALKVGQKIKVSGDKGSLTKTSVLATTKTDTKVPDLKANDPHNYSSKKADSSLVWPVKTENIVYINGKVGGVSLAAKKDEEVKAIRAGTVMFSGSYRGFGNVVFIQSKTGHIYAYTGLGSIDVSKGDYINYSKEIGRAGIDTYTGKSQISLMVFQNGQPIDPAKAPRG